MSLYKLAQFVSSFIQNYRPGLVSSSTSTAQIHKDLSTDAKTNNDSESTSSMEKENSRTIIRPRTARLWLNKLRYRYTDIKKGVFLDSHKQPDVVEDRHWFLSQLEKLLPYLVEFCEDGSMMLKQYPSDCAVNGPNRWPCILITHDESTFSANNGRHQAWLKERHAFL